MKVGLEVSNIIDTITRSSGTQVYRLGTRNAATTLRLKDGETQILAGLNKKDDRRAINKVPGLSELPIVGRLFSNHADNNTKTEIVLLITPRIVRNIVRPEADVAEFSSGTDSSTGAGSARSVRTVRAAKPAGRHVTSAAYVAAPNTCIAITGSRNGLDAHVSVVARAGAEYADRSAAMNLNIIAYEHYSKSHKFAIREIDINEFAHSTGETCCVRGASRRYFGGVRCNSLQRRIHSSQEFRITLTTRPGAMILKRRWLSKASFASWWACKHRTRFARTSTPVPMTRRNRRCRDDSNDCCSV